MFPTYKSFWTKDDFLAYTLLYAAHADFVFDDEERDMIISKVDYNAYKNVINELLNDNDYQSLQKILKYINEHKYDKKDIDILLHEIELLFMCDGEYDALEKNMMFNLTRLLKHHEDPELLV